MPLDVRAGLAQRMGGGAPPAPPPMPGAPGPPMPQPMPPGPPGMEGGGDPVQNLAEALGEARMAVGEMGPERFATEGKELLRGFIGSITQLQSEMAGAQAGPQAMPPGPGAPAQMGPPPAPAGFPPGP